MVQGRYVEPLPPRTAAELLPARDMGGAYEALAEAEGAAPAPRVLLDRFGVLRCS